MPVRFRPSSLVPLLIAALIVMASYARAAVAPDSSRWVMKCVSTVTLQQSAYSDNWSGGDRGSWTWVARFNAEAERQWTRRLNLSHQLEVSYGQTSKQELDPADADRRVWLPPSKTNDRLLFETLARFTLDRPLDPYASLRVESQFLDQSQPNGTIMVNPIRLKLSAGISRVFLDAADRGLSARLGVGGRLTTGRNFDVLPPERHTARYTNRDLGVDAILEGRTPLAGDRMGLRGRLTLFQPLVYSQADQLKLYDAFVAAVVPGHRPIARDWRTINVDLETTFTGRISRMFSVELFTRLVYIKFDTSASLDRREPIDVLVSQVERNVRRAGQLRQSLALALSWRMF